LAFSPMIKPDYKHAQMIYVIVILVFYTCVTSRKWPWKTHVFNVLDVFVCTSLTFLLMLATTILDPQPLDVYNQLATIVTFGLLFMFVVVVMLATVNILRKGLESDFGESYTAFKRLEDVAIDFQTMCVIISRLSPERFTRVLLTMNFFDLHVLESAVSSVQAVGNKDLWISNALPPRLVGLHTAGQAQRVLRFTDDHFVNQTGVVASLAHGVSGPANTKRDVVAETNRAAAELFVDGVQAYKIGQPGDKPVRESFLDVNFVALSDFEADTKQPWHEKDGTTPLETTRTKGDAAVQVDILNYEPATRNGLSANTIDPEPTKSLPESLHICSSSRYW